MRKSYSELRSLAHYQIEAMCQALLRAAQDDGCDTLPYLVQSLAIRIDNLNGSLMCGVDNEIEIVIADLHREVTHA